MSQPQSQQSKMVDLARANAEREQLWRSLAVNIAKDIVSLDDILAAHGITHSEYYQLQENVVFKAMLMAEMQAWVAAENASERIKLKYLSMVEQSAPEFFAAMVDPKESLGDRTKLLQTIMKGAGIGQDAMDAAKAGAAGGARVSISITMGSNNVNYDKKLPPRVIDNNVNREVPAIDYGAEIVEETQDLQDGEDEEAAA